MKGIAKRIGRSLLYMCMSHMILMLAAINKLQVVVLLGLLWMTMIKMKKQILASLPERETGGSYFSCCCSDVF